MQDTAQDTEQGEAQDTEQALIEVLDRNLVYARDGAVVYESVIESEYPSIDIGLLCSVYADNLGCHGSTVSDYLRFADDPLVGDAESH